MTDRAGVALVDDSGNLVAMCLLDCASTVPNCNLVPMLADGSPGARLEQEPVPFLSISFRGQTESTQATFTCGPFGPFMTSVSQPLGSSTGRPVVFATPNFSVTYFEVVD